MKILVVAGWLTLVTSGAAACGICVDDKVAATYDYAVMQRADANGHAVVFCEVKGSVDVHRLETSARQVRGVDAGSVRISQQPTGISFALDRKQLTPQKAAAALERRIPGVHVTILKVVDASPKS